MKLGLFTVLLFSLMHVSAYNSYQVDQLLNALSQDEQLNCAGCDFRGLGDLLQGKDLSNFNLSGVLFNSIADSATPAGSLVKIPGQKSDLSGAIFAQATLVSTSFKGAVLQDADFTGADISYADFSNADLTGVKGLDSAKNSSLASFAGAVMPDGSKPTGSTWTSSSGKIFYLRNQ